MLTFSEKSGFKQTTTASFGCCGGMELQAGKWLKDNEFVDVSADVQYWSC